MLGAAVWCLAGWVAFVHGDYAATAASWAIALLFGVLDELRDLRKTLGG